MKKTIISPGKYVQGAGEIKHLSTYTSQHGKKVMVISTASGLKRTKDKILSSYENASDLYFENFDGECSKNEINRIKEAAGKFGAEVIMGIGGGKTLDTAKAVAHYMQKPVVIVPTIASTDAPCSALAVIYTDSGEFEEYLFLPSNPNVVVVDTEIVAQAPARLLVSGMGDALATYFEARACINSNANTIAGSKATMAAYALSELCYDTLIQQGLKAKIALDAKALTPAVEAIIEANTLLSGIGFESCGLAGAHAIHNGLTVLEKCHGYYHGEKVAFGTLVQLILENSPIEEISEVLEFCHSVGLPTTLADIGLEDVTDEELMKVAAASCAEGDTIHNMPFEVTEETVFSAIKAADAIGRSCC